MASLLVGVMCQALVPTEDGVGRVPAIEMMLANTAIRSLIREGKIHQIPNVIRTHASEGMMVMDQSLVALYKDGLISGKNLTAFCNDRSEVEKLIGDVNVNPVKPRQAEPFQDFYQGVNITGGLQGGKQTVKEG